MGGHRPRKMKEVINMDNGYEFGYDSGMEDFAKVIDKFCLDISREYEENAGTHAKKNEDLNACFWQGAVFALKVVRKEIERLNE